MFKIYKFQFYVTCLLFSLQLGRRESYAQLTDLPEPDNLLAVEGVVSVDRVALPVLYIDLLHAAQHQFQLPLVEVLEPLERHHLVEPLQERLRLLLNPPGHPPLRQTPVNVNYLNVLGVERIGFFPFRQEKGQGTPFLA